MSRSNKAWNLASEEHGLTRAETTRGAFEALSDLLITLRQESRNKNKEEKKDE